MEKGVDMAGNPHDEHDHYAAVFDDPEAAESAIGDLQRLGVQSEHLGILVRRGESVAFEHDEETELERDAEIGVVAGLPLGALAGILISSLVVPGIGVGGMLAVSGASALWGALLGGFVGTAEGSVGWDEHQAIGLTYVAPGQTLVVVCSHGNPDAVCEAMENHGGCIVDVSPTRG